MQWTRAIIMLGMASAGGACIRPVDLTGADAGPGPGACPELTDGLDAEQCAAIRGMAFVEELPPSRGNMYADSAKAAVFGFYNFFDTSLSGSGKFSCETCHKPEAA